MRRRFVVFAVVLISLIVAAHLSQVRLGALFDSEGSANASDLLRGLAHPDLSNTFLARIVKLSIESLFIGVVGTAIAALIGFSLAMMAIRVPRLPEPPGGSRLTTWAGDAVRIGVRFVLGIFRSIPDLVWAYLFVRLLGLGPGPAVLAIAVSTGGIMGKLFTELAEAVDPEPIHALRRAGIGRLGILLHGVLPQVRRQWVAYGLFRVECSVRSASILGVVGAGGLGSEIALSVRYFEYDKLATALLAVLVFVVAFELISAFLRRRPVVWTFGAAAVGTVAGLVYLDVPWRDLWSSSFLPSISFGGIDDTFAFVRHALVLTLQTVAMAWCATVGAAAIAFCLAPLSCGTLTLGRYRRDSPRGHGWFRGLCWGMFIVSRAIFQIFRAMPELTLALIFVVWVGPGPFAGVLAVGVHTIGVLGRLYTDTYEDVERGPVGALESTGGSRLAIWLYGVVPQVSPRLLAFTLYRFEVNVRATAMVGFIAAGGIGDAIHTAISLFHMGDLVLLLAVMLAVVTALDWVGDRARFRLLTARYGAKEFRLRQRLNLQNVCRPEELQAPPLSTREHIRHPTWRTVFYRQRADDNMEVGFASSVSAGGLFIHTNSPLPKGLVIDVIVVSPEAKLDTSVVSCRGRVAYASRVGEIGIGVQLLDATPRFLELLGLPASEIAEAHPDHGNRDASSEPAPAVGELRPERQRS